MKFTDRERREALPCDEGQSDLAHKVADLEKTLKEKDLTFWQLVDLFPMALLLYDSSGRILHFSRAFTSTFGYSPEETPDVDTWWLRMAPDPAYRHIVLEHWQSQIESLEKGKAPAPFEAVLLSRDGTPHIARISTIFIANMKVIVLTDITEARRMEETMKNILQDSIPSDDGLYCRILIEDNGPGIKDSRKQTVFGRGGHRLGSKGIGLYLARTVIESIHGRIWVEDRIPGDYRQGSRIVILIPAISVDTGTVAAAAHT